ncbi:MAG: gamma-glutamyltransferase [Fimbriimonadaceae bacterium]|nr:gamma-glutamyltransferase [Fimbriimonadaceae bacterium]
MLTGRPVVRAPRAMIAAAHPLAVQAGLALLRDGGTAVDAGLAVNLALNVTQVPCCGVGGDAFILYWDAASGTLHAYNASGRSPADASIAALRERGHQTMPLYGPLSVNVPGMLDGWEALHQRFGRLPWRELFAPAIGYARDGHPVSDNLAGWIRGAQERLRQWPASTHAVLPDNHAPRAGQRLRQPDLAATLELLAAEGRRALYEGDLGAEIARAVAAAGGLLTRDDLAAHRGEWSAPVGTTYRGYEVLVHGPNSQGWTLPLMLSLIADHDFGRLPPAGVAAVHLGIEAKRLAFADRDAYNTDPTALPLDVRRLLDPTYVARRRQLLSAEHAMPDPSPGRPDGDTTYFAVVDPAGNALSVIQSLYHGFGSGFVAGSSGLFLQNRGGYFSLDEQHVNALAPRKRTAHTLVSAMVLRDGRPVIVPGTMGGDGQPQILFQILTALIDHRLNPQQAIELPRWVHGHTDRGPCVQLEDRLGDAVIDGLRRLGHPVERLGERSGTCGHAQVITLDQHGLAAGADPRGDGQAAGF